MILFPKLDKHPYFTESIYNWESIECFERQKEKSLYQSKYKGANKEFYDSTKSSYPKTMGFAKTPVRNPQDYLKKHSSEKRLREDTKAVRCDCRDPRRCCKGTEEIPRNQTPVLKKECNRNFVEENSLSAQRRPPSDPVPRLMDDRKGNSFDLENSGLVPKYTRKEDYGQKPKYIEDIEKSLEESRARFWEFLFAEKLRTMPERMSEETKEKLYEGLVKNWKELLRRYLMLPIRTETPLQLKRKLEIERRIDALEQDIELLVRNKDIFIGKGNVTRQYTS